MLPYYVFEKLLHKLHKTTRHDMNFNDKIESSKCLLYIFIQLVQLVRVKLVKVQLYTNS